MDFSVSFIVKDLRKEEFLHIVLLITIAVEAKVTGDRPIKQFY